MCIHDFNQGAGTVIHMGVDTALVCGPWSDGWETERTSFATVTFDDGMTRDIELADLVSEEQVVLYRSLRPGDFIVWGRRKQARSIVLHAGRGNRRVIVLEGGAKRPLSLRHTILAVQRADA